MKKLTLLMGLIGLLYIQAVGQNTSQEVSTIEVRGTSKLSVKPDLAVFQIEMANIQADADAATKQLNASVAKLEREWIKAGFKKEQLTTSNYSVVPNRIYRNNNMKDSGFVASQLISFTFPNVQKDLEKAVAVISKNVSNNMSVNFTLSDEKKAAIKKQLLQMAIADAKEKGNVIFEGLGISSTAIHQVRHYGESQIAPRASFDMAAMKMSPSIEAKALDITDEITIVWKIK
ncbi:SIMPL domain-containing protein [Penaeicola halotolerans]|uniref:SIMPL domain-containing protein n=1 Tax=Penaeicola halotolerans TaxID=2793196 RepID=UPI001CF91E3D|nr:SIMPL domain-containing protein [Penaeicola halotolerans]